MLSTLRESLLQWAPASGLRMRFGRGVVFSLVAAVFNNGSTLLVNILVANLLGRAVFGEYAIIQNTLLTLSIMASLGTGATTSKYVAEFRSVDQARASRILGLCSALALGMGAVFTLALVVGAPGLARLALNAPHLALALALSSTVIFFNTVNFVQIGALTGLEGYVSLARAGIIAGVAYTLLCSLGAWLWGREGAAAGLAISAAVQWLALRHYLSRECLRQGLTIDYRGLTTEREVVTHFALPAALSGFSFMPVMWLANATLARQPGGYAQVGLYAAATNFRVIVLFMPQLLNSVATSLLNNARGERQASRYWKVFWGNLACVAAVALSGALAMSLFGPALLNLFGRSFGDGYSVLVVLMSATVIEALAQAAYQVILSEAHLWLSLLAVSLPRDMTILLTAIFLAPVYGAIGLAYAYGLGWGVALLATIGIATYLGRKMHIANSTVGQRP